jgi:hypothetical protein
MMTKDEFAKSLAADFSSAVEATYQDLIKAAVAAERDALEAELLKLKKGIGGSSMYIQGRWDLIGEFQDIIRARGNRT